MPEKMPTPSLESAPEAERRKKRGALELGKGRLTETDDAFSDLDVDTLKDLEIPHIQGPKPKEKFAKTKALLKKLGQPEISSERTGYVPPTEMKEGRRQNVDQEPRVVIREQEAEAVKKIDEMRGKILESDAEDRRKAKILKDIELVKYETGKLHEKINKVIISQTAINRFRGLMSNLTGGRYLTPWQKQIKGYEEQLKYKEAEENDLTEELLMSTYREGIQQAAGLPRKVAGTPKIQLRKEALDREDRMAAEGTYGKNVGKSEVEMEVEYGLKDKGEHQLEEFEKSLEADPKRATEVLPNAAKLWDHLTKEIQKNLAGINAQKKDQPHLTNQEIMQGATNIVLRLAQFKKAMEVDNLGLAQKYQDEVARLAHEYLLENDPQILKVYNLEAPEKSPEEKPQGPRTISTENVKRSLGRRRERTARQERRFKH